MKIAVFLFLTFATITAIAADEEKRSWTNETELSGVWTSGNSETSTLGLRNDFGRTVEKNKFSAKTGGVHAKSGDDVTVEQYYLNLNLDHMFTEKAYWYASAGWKRDEIAGVTNNSTLGTGVGKHWLDTDKRKFSTDIGLGYIFRDYVIEPPDFEDGFATVQFGLKHFQQVTDSSAYKQELELNQSLEGEKGMEVVWEHGFTVTVSKLVALKIGYRLDYNSEPAFKDATLTEKLDDLDTTFTTSLVINF